ncbi:DsbA family oxidoreductase [Acinetobacter nectaris]|uniref:DsbA family oxidoreductase n=1 Tax=Acinetobacter nectaris TaxID=1219382 RepID=UPI001F27F118|nr:DsbA family oxidoreductase [Acinetobacter nectaris]MCF9000107.1 DsbA family oxidoreductase [Acinetobacter nectaris]MCF9027141.1 DsbA family oxidoreductase [Acinetobacter nectaris]
MRVDIWSDVVCPFCYIGKKRLERVAEEMNLDLEIHWHSFQLDPKSPASFSVPTTELIAKKYGRSIEEMEAMQVQIAEMAAEEGINFQWRKTKAGNSFDAHRVIHLAQSKGLGNKAKEAFFHAYMTEGLAIGERETVEEIASRIGLENGEVEDMLNSNEFAEFVKYDEDLAREKLNVTGVPFFVFDQRVALAGAQPAQVFEEVIQKTLASKDEKAATVSEPESNAQCNDDSCDIKQD